MTPTLMRSLAPSTRLLWVPLAPRAAKLDFARPNDNPTVLAVFRKSLRSTEPLSDIPSPVLGVTEFSLLRRAGRGQKRSIFIGVLGRRHQFELEPESRAGRMGIGVRLRCKCPRVSGSNGVPPAPGTAAAS